jgi:hypothetical protein
VRPLAAAPLAALALALLAGGCLGAGDEAAEERRAAARDEPAAERRACLPTEGGGARVDPAPEGAASRVRLGPGMALDRSPSTLRGARIGKPLHVSGVVRDERCAPLAGATVRAWQANGDGRYGPGSGERMRCCYLQGAALTDAGGRYALDTVVPDGYAGGRPHIHVQAAHPAATGVETEIVVEPAGMDVVDGRLFRTTFDVVLRAG